MRIDVRTLGPTLMALLALACNSAAAQSSPWWAGGMLQYSRDSNIYRLPDGAAPLGPGRAESDSILTTTLIAGLDQPIGRQRLRLDASLRDSRFGDNKLLDNNGHAVKLGLDWATIGRLSGTVSVLSDRSLVRFESGALGSTSLERNIADTKQFDLLARVGLVTRLSGELAFNHQQVDYSAAAFEYREYRQNLLRAGVRYTPSGLISLAASVRGTQGRYPRFARNLRGDFIADRYTGRNLDLSALYTPSGVSQFEARISLGSTSYERSSASDLSGATGQLAWIWRPTGKLRTETRLQRDRGQDSVPVGFSASGRFADFSRASDTLSVAAHYELSAKVSLSAALTTSRRDLVDSRLDLLGNPVVRSGSDRSSIWQAGARWLPTRALTLGCDYSHERRRTDSTLSSDYSVSTLGCFGQMLLQ